MSSGKKDLGQDPGKSDQRLIEMSEYASLVERLTEAERQIAKIESTTAKEKDTGKIQIDLGRLQNTAEVFGDEIKNLRLKQESDMEKSLAQSREATKFAAAAGKPDYKVHTGFASIGLVLMGLLTGYVTTGDNRVADHAAAGLSALTNQLLIDNDTLLGEIGEAKDAASSAAKKASPVMIALKEYQDKTNIILTDLQQRVPSQSEWKKADAAIEHLRNQKLQLRERMTQAEGRIERSLLLINKEEEARLAAEMTINERLDSNSKNILAINTSITSLKSTMNGFIAEVESQLRGFASTTNGMISSLRQNLAMIFPRVFDQQSMPENDYYGLQDLPAKANVNLNSNGGN